MGLERVRGVGTNTERRGRKEEVMNAILAFVDGDGGWKGKRVLSRAAPFVAMVVPFCASRIPATGDQTLEHDVVEFHFILG